MIRRRRQASPAEKSSDEQDGYPQDNACTLLSEDVHQHGLMVAAYRDVGNEYAVDRGQLRKGGICSRDSPCCPDISRCSPD